MKTAIAGIIIVLTYVILLLVVAICSPGCYQTPAFTVLPGMVKYTVVRPIDNGYIVNEVAQDTAGKFHVLKTEIVEEK